MSGKRHHDVSPPKFTSLGALGRPNTSSETSTSKRASKVPLGAKPDSPDPGISRDSAAGELHIGQLKMDMPLVSIVSR